MGRILKDERNCETRKRDYILFNAVNLTTRFTFCPLTSYVSPFSVRANVSRMAMVLLKLFSQMHPFLLLSENERDRKKKRKKEEEEEKRRKKKSFFT